MPNFILYRDRVQVNLDGRAWGVDLGRSVDDFLGFLVRPVSIFAEDDVTVLGQRWQDDEGVARHFRSHFR